MLKLSSVVFEILARGLPYDNNIFTPFVSNDPVCAVRLLHYPPQTSRDERQLGAGAHTDFGKFSLVLGSSVEEHQRNPNLLILVGLKEQ